MFTYEERRALTTIMEKLKAELPNVQQKMEAAEEARSLAEDYYDMAGSEYAWGLYEEAQQEYRDLYDKAQSLEWMANHLSRFIAELEFIDWLCH